MLSPNQRQQLLTIARDTIAAKLDDRRLGLNPADFDEDLRRPSGAFVSLHTKDGELRGCIGSIYPMAPLFEAVSSSALNAAFSDPRFPSLNKDELANVEIEISVMGPLEPVKDASEVEVGRDGLIVSRGRQAGLLLPQVATDYGWDRDTFLRQTCVKAGLQPDAWRSPECRIERFAAEVFSE